MLNPNPITDVIAATLTAIPQLNAAMSVEGVCRINSYHYRMGVEVKLEEAIYKMPSPSMLVAFEKTHGGNFDGGTIFKHQWCVYFRMANMAGVQTPIGYEDLWWIVCNENPTGSPVNIRYMQLYSGLDIMDTPSITHMVDQEQIDIFRADFIFPEIGDQ